jgi:hypothetical protein
VLAGEGDLPASTDGFSVASGHDRFGRKRIIGNISQLFVKVGTADTQGNFFVIEHQHTAQGGPPRHTHGIERVGPPLRIE